MYAHALGLFSNDDPGLTLTIFMTESNLFPDASVWMPAYNTALYAHVFPRAYPQHSGERYRTYGLLVLRPHDDPNFTLHSTFI